MVRVCVRHAHRGGAGGIHLCSADYNLPLTQTPASPDVVETSLLLSVHSRGTCLTRSQLECRIRIGSHHPRQSIPTLRCDGSGPGGARTVQPPGVREGLGEEHARVQREGASMPVAMPLWMRWLRMVIATAAPSATPALPIQTVPRLALHYQYRPYHA